MIEETYIYTEIHAKGNKTDPVYQDFLIRVNSAGNAEYFHPQLCRWFDLPTAWEPLLKGG